MTWRIENIWAKRASRGNNLSSLLVLDSFTARKTDAAVEQRFREKKNEYSNYSGLFICNLMNHYIESLKQR